MVEIKTAMVTKSTEYEKLFNVEKDIGAGTAKDNCCGGSSSE